MCEHILNVLNVLKELFSETEHSSTFHLFLENQFRHVILYKQWDAKGSK